MKTIDFKGKPYVEVSERIKHFREHYPEWSLISKIESVDNGVCIVRAVILDGDDRERASGIAYENEGSSFINKTSYIENCETSAWGRALANLGIGIDATIASADEVGNAIKQQDAPVKLQLNKPTIESRFKEYLALLPVQAQVEWQMAWDTCTNDDGRISVGKGIAEKVKELNK